LSHGYFTTADGHCHGFICRIDAGTGIRSLDLNLVPQFELNSNKMKKKSGYNEGIGYINKSENPKTEGSVPSFHE
jgi:hypothetical protein